MLRATHKLRALILRLGKKRRQKIAQDPQRHIKTLNGTIMVYDFIPMDSSWISRARLILYSYIYPYNIYIYIYISSLSLCLIRSKQIAELFQERVCLDVIIEKEKKTNTYKNAIVLELKVQNMRKKKKY